MDQGWGEFLSALAAKDVELSDLDFGLQQEPRASPQARADFLAFDITTPDAHHYDPDKRKTPEDWLHKEETIYRPSISRTPTLWDSRGPNQGCNATVPPKQPPCPIIDPCLKLANNFTQTPSSSSTTPRFRLIQETTESRPLRPRCATKFFYFEDYQPLDSPSQYSCYLINERLRADHLYACQWFSENIDKFIRFNRRLSSTTGRSPSRTIQIFILQGCHASHGTS